MEKFIINGGTPLHGSVSISGAKNAALAIIPAAILSQDVCVIENLPTSISDVGYMMKILNQLGAKVKLINKHTIEIDSRHINSYIISHDMTKHLRASYYFIGALLGRFSRAKVALPGGCYLGPRPIDQHIKGFEALGATVSIEDNAIVEAEAEKLIGTPIYLDVASVGATVNILLAAVKSNGLTVIENAAKEPHIVDLANFLNSMGADVRGAGTDVIKVRGVDQLHGCTYSIIPDQIEAGTFMVAAAATKGDVLIRNVIPKHLESISKKLVECGATVEEFEKIQQWQNETGIQVIYPAITDAKQTNADIWYKANKKGVPTMSKVDKDGDGVDETNVIVSEAKSFNDFYTEMAERLGTDICYVARAYALAYQENPELALPMWGYDNAHVSNEGAYLNGCVLFCHTFGVSCENVGDDFLDPEMAAFLRDIADRVVLEGELPNW